MCVSLRAPALAALLLLIVAAPGCVRFRAGDDLRPPAHPLLEALFQAEDGPLAPTLAEASEARPRRTESTPRPPPEPPAPDPAFDLAAVVALVGKRGLQHEDLLRAGLGAGHPAARMATWRGHAKPAPPAPGHLVQFRAEAPEVPVFGVIRRTEPGRPWEVIAITRGAVRVVWVDPDRPDRRREDRTLLNTFLRMRKSDDPPGARYLAGQLVDEVLRFGPADG